METWLLFALVGLGTGAVYASLGMGLVMTYKGTGVVNLAMAAMAMWPAFVYAELRSTGELVLPLVLLPDRIALGGPASFPVALGLALGSAALVGLLVHVLVLRPLRNAPVLAKVVATVGVFVAIQSLVTLQFGNVARVPSAILPNAPVDVLGAGVNRDRLLLAGIALAMGLAVSAWFRWSRTGLAVRAAAENERAASFAGFSPAFLGGVTLVAATVAASLMAILAAPLTTLNGGFPLLVVPALAVALLGGLRSPLLAVIAGLALGMLQSVLTYVKTLAWYPDWATTGVNDAVPFLVIVAALFLLGRSLPQRGAQASDRLPPVLVPRSRPRLVAALLAVGVLAIVLTEGSWRLGIATSLIVTVICLSLVLLTGLVGQISLAQAAFAGAAGFALSKIGTALPFPISAVAAALVAAGLGVLVGIPALRIRGAQLAVVTMAAAIAIEQFVFRNPGLSPVGGNLIPDPVLLGLDFGVRSGRDIARVEFGLLVLAVTALVAWAVANLMRSASGRRLLAIRTNERAGASLGVNVAATKLTAFALASFIAGIGGTLLGYSRGQLSPDSFGVLVGLTLLAYAYLGGITSIQGAFLAGMFAPLGIFYVLYARLIGPRVESVDELYALIGGVGLVVTAIAYPAGMAGALRWRRRRTASAPETPVPTPEPAPKPLVDARSAAPGAARPTGAPPAGETLLRARGVTVTFGGVRAVDDVDLDVGAGRICGLIGPNGAGKTTFIDAVTGFVPAGGEVSVRGRAIASLPAHARSRAGLVRTWQSLELFDELTVRQNVMIGAEPASLRGLALDVVRPERRRDEAQVDWALELVGLADVAHVRPSELPLGRQKLVGVARALGMRPTVLLLDEPTAGLDPDESAEFGVRLRDVVADGTGVLLIDHDMSLVLDVCDELSVLSFGRVIAHGAPQEIRSDGAVVEAYLGHGGLTGSAGARQEAGA